MADWFLSNDGDNAKDGTSNANAKADWTNLMALTATPGTTYNVRYGDKFYITADTASKNGQHGSPGNPVVITPYGDASLGLPKIIGMQLLDGTWSNSGAMFPDDNAVITGGGNTVWAYDLGANASSQNAQLWIDGVGYNDHLGTTTGDSLAWDTVNHYPKAVFTDPANQGGKFSVSTETDGNTGGYIYLCTDSNPNTDGKTYECVVNNGLVDQIFRFFDADYWQIYDIDFQGGYTNGCIWCSGNSARTNTGIVLDGCRFSRSLGNMLHVSTGGATQLFDLTIQDCYFGEQLEHGTHGIRFKTGNGHNALIQNSVFEKCDHGIQFGSGGVGGSAGWVKGTLRYCKFYRTKDDGIWDGGGNVVGSGTLDIYENFFLKCGDQGIQFSGHQNSKNANIRIWNNTIRYCNQGGILLYNAESSCESYNNLVENCNRRDRYTQQLNNEDYVVEVAGANGPTVDYNLVYSDLDNPAEPGTDESHRAAAANEFVQGTVTDTASVTWHTNDWAAYLSASSQDANSVNADPLLASSNADTPADCIPLAGSPAIGAGLSVGLTRDFFGTPIPQSGAVDIGAVQTSYPTVSGKVGGTRIYQQSAANTQNYFRLSGSSPALSAPHFGQLIRVDSVMVSWSAAVTEINHKVVLDSGLGAAYDATLVSEDFTGQYWVWTFGQGGFLLMPQYDGMSSDALTVTIASGGAGLTSYLTIRYEVL